MTQRIIRSAPLALWGRIVLVTGTLIAAGCAAEKPSNAAAGQEPPTLASPLGNFLAGRFAQDSQDYNSAADYLLRALSGDPQNPELLDDTMKALIGAGRMEEARATATKLIEIEPKAAGANIVLALGELKRGAYKSADARLGSISPQGLNGFVVPLVRAWVAAGEGQPDRALDVLSPVGKQQGFEAVYQLNVALINENAGRAGPAGEAFRKALGNSELPPFRLVQIAGGFYERSGQADKAKELYKTFAQENEGSSRSNRSSTGSPPATRPSPWSATPPKALPNCCSTSPARSTRNGSTSRRCFTPGSPSTCTPISRWRRSCWVT